MRFILRNIYSAIIITDFSNKCYNNAIILTREQIKFWRAELFFLLKIHIMYIMHNFLLRKKILDGFRWWASFGRQILK
jgi:hypothetical protein